MPMSRILWLAGVATVGLSGCASFERNCHEPQAYERAESVPPLQVPEGLTAPQTRGALKIPDVDATARPRGPTDPCLDEPPSFYPGRPKPGASRIGTDPAAPAAAPAGPGATAGGPAAAGAAPTPAPAEPPKP